MRPFLKLVLLIILVSIVLPASAAVRVASWNIKHAGWGDKDFGAVATVASRFDLLALEEVMKPKAIDTLVHDLEQQTGDDWASSVSHAIGRGSYKESYAFVWRTKVVASKGGATVYLDPGDVFARQPYSAIFADRESGQTFVMAAVHILYGDSRSDRTPEIKALDTYWGWLHKTFGQPVILAGDFNLSPGDPAWRHLRGDAQPQITHGASTLSPVDGRYAHLYDNLWVTKGSLDVTSSGIGRYPAWLGINHKQGRKMVSDHAPVYLTLGHVTVDTGRADRRRPQMAAHRCIDLNNATTAQLEQLDHVGPAYARRIANGRPWKSIDGLTRIRGLSASYVADIRRSRALCPL